MKLLGYIKDKKLPPKGQYHIREASRGIVFDENKLIPLLFVSKENYYKLPGGGFEGKEDAYQACERETEEETGCDIEIIGEVGKIIEYRSEFNLKQTSYCYWGKISKKGIMHLEQSEIDEGFELIWLSLDEAISRVKNTKPKNYEGGFIQKRDLIFLSEAKRILKANLLFG